MLQEITALFERLKGELPPDTATLRVYQVPRGGGSIVELKPTNPAAADFGVHCDITDIFSFGFGVLSQWEFPHERRYRKNEKDAVAEIEEMSRAVIAGKCEQIRHWFSLTARIYVDGYTYEVSDMPMIPRPPFGTRRFAPYVQSHS